MRFLTLLSPLVFFVAAGVAPGQTFDPPAPKTPDAATLQAIETKTAELRKLVGALTPTADPKHELALKAAEWIVKYREWFAADSGKQTVSMLDKAIARAADPLLRRTVPVPGRGVVYGYRSQLDRSVQPYAVFYPPDFGKDPKKQYRLDIVLHGRDASLTEMKFFTQYDDKPSPKDMDPGSLQLIVYGRGNNAYRWAGEDDVFSAFRQLTEPTADNPHAFRDSDGQLASCVDLQRVILKGFSMGGAGTWHLGLRYPSLFAVLQPGAGFTTTRGYIAKLPDPLPDYQEKCLRIYDALGYAENAFNAPIVAYSGEIDKQRQAAVNIENRLKELRLNGQMTHVIGPKLEHKFPPEQVKIVEAKLREILDSQAKTPDRLRHVRFVTYTLKNSTCHWVSIDQLQEHYRRTLIDAKLEKDSVTIETVNVVRFTIFDPDRAIRTAKIDGQVIPLPAVPTEYHSFVRSDGKWSLPGRSMPAESRFKSQGLCGPIDDAFTSPFVCVIGSGTPHNPAMHAAAKAQLDRFAAEWEKFFRGKLIVKTDAEVTFDELKERNLILFGDPGSNRLIAQALREIPFLKWDADTLNWGGTKYDAKTHLPMFVQPAPASTNQHRYLAINTGHTFHAADFQGTNALLYPRLGDFAIVRPNPTAKDPTAFEVVEAGLFDEFWNLPKK
jgi:predicted esterase